MPTERLSAESNTLDVSSLDAQTKMKYILEIFDLAKDKEKIEERRQKFMDLLRSYNLSYIKSKNDLSGKRKQDEYEAGRAELHNKIMEIIVNMSLSMGLSKEQREVVSYLSEDRAEVTNMISSYFSGVNSTTINTPSEYARMKDQLNTLGSKDGPEEE